VSDVIPNCPISEKLKLPVAKYNNDTPNKNIPEEKAPKIKYFNPASVDRRDRVLMEANAYRGRLNNSIVIYMVKKSYEATSQHPPKQDKRTKIENSKKFTFSSAT